MKFYWITFLFLIFSNVNAESLESAVFVDYNGVTVWKNCQFDSDANRWNLSTKNDRKILVPTKKYKEYPVKIEVIASTDCKKLGVKKSYDTRPKSLVHGEEYRFNDKIIKIKNDVAEVYSYQNCQKVLKNLDNVKSCMNILEKFDFGSEISKDQLEMFPELGKVKVAEGIQDNNIQSSTKVASSKLSEVISTCEELERAIDKTKLTEDFSSKSTEVKEYKSVSK